MRFHGLSVAAIALAAAGPSWAGDIRPVVNVSTEKAHDLRGVNFAPDGQKIYAAGHVGTVPEQTKTVVARFNADGTPDTTFGGSGFVEVDLAAGRSEQTLALAVLSNGDVLVPVSAVDADGGQSVYLLRFDSNGARKVAPAWGDADGKVEVVFGWANADNASYPGVQTPPQDTAWDIQVDRSTGAERLVIFGLGPAAKGTGRTDVDRYVVRLNAADGKVDPAFNGGKPFTFHSTGTFGDNARRGSVEPDGSIVSSGYTPLGNLAAHVVLIRLTPDGTPDPKFGNFISPASSGTAVGLTPKPGVAVFNPFVGNGGFAENYGAARLKDGSYVTTGYGAATGNATASTLGYKTTLGPDLVTFRVKGSALDPSWGNNGTQAIQSEGKGQPTNEERGRAMIALPDDRTVQAGRYGGNAAVYVFDAKGQLDATQDGGGIIQLGHPTIGGQFFNAALSPDGKRIALTTSADPRGARLVVLEVQR